MTAHTPGPWKRDENFWLVGPNNHYVVRVGASSPADARLIAAAPDLLAALRVVAGIPIENFGKGDRPADILMAWDGHELKVSDVLAARAAIAKAEGR